MSVSLRKGQRVSLKKEDASLNKLMIGLGWDATKYGHAADLDATVFEVGDVHGFLGSKRAIIDEISYRSLRHSSTSKDKAVRHHGDNLVGGCNGDSEQISINLKKVDPNAEKLVCVVNIFDAHDRKQDFGAIENAYIRLVNEETGKEIARYNLTDDYDGKTAMIMGEIYRHNNEWKFAAIGEGTMDNSISDLKKRKY